MLPRTPCAATFASSTTRSRRPAALRLTLAALLLLARPVAAQEAPASAGGSPPAPSSPVWNKVLPLPDGRTLVTDGAFALDAAIARPATLPTVVLPKATGARYDAIMQAPAVKEVRARDLRPGRRNYLAPDGTPFNPLYVDYLRRTVNFNTLAFRINGGPLDPVVVVLDGRPVGVVMPMAR
jgi:hypothetical protein